MTKRDRALERLARDICWVGFSVPKFAGCTKLQYWAKISMDAKQDYRAHARQFLHLVEKLGLKRIEAALAATDGTLPTLEHPTCICCGALTWEHDHRADNTGLDDGPPINTPRKRPTPKSGEEMSGIRAQAWATRREKYGPHGHR